MLICCVRGKVKANVIPSVVHYGGCASCPLEEVQEEMERIRPERSEKRPEDERRDGR